MTSYLAREIAARLGRARRHLPVVVLSGLRQSGKSTFLGHELSNVGTYRTLDDFDMLAAARANPEAFIDAVTTLDEVQRCPELLVAVKRAVDRDRRPGRFVLSGSANLALLAHVSETLAGRAVYLTLRPMTRRELNGHANEPPFLLRFLDSPALPAHRAQPLGDAEILRGGLPPAVLGPADGIGEWFRGYVQTYVERDVRQLARVSDLVAFRTLVQLTARRTQQVLNVASLARDASMNVATTTRHLGLLEASFLVWRLPPFLRNRTTRLVKSPKLVFADSGLAAHVAGVSDLADPREAQLRGALVETYVAHNLAAIIEAHRPDAELSYWHEQGRHEVDFIVSSGPKVMAIEVKAAARWSPRDLSGLRAFIERTPSCVAGVLAHNGREALKLEDRLWAIPLGHLLA